MSSTSSPKSLYAIALGSNRRHRRCGPPRRVLVAAQKALEDAGVVLIAQSSIIESAPIGPSLRRYANQVIIVETALEPTALLTCLKTIERQFGRRRAQRWAARVLDLDIILWSGGSWADYALIIPHIAFRSRDFVLRPLCTIAPRWRDPVTQLSVRQLFHRLNRKTPVDRQPRHP